MKIAPYQLAQNLSNGLAPIYIISGDEPLQKQEARDLICQKAKQSGFEEHQYLQVDAGFNWDQLLQSANSLSLFASQTILELRMNSAKPGKAGGAILQNYAEDLPSDKLLLVVMPKADAATQKTKWFTALSNKGAYVPIWPIDAEHLPRWVSTRLKQADLSADPSGVKLLCEYTEGNLLATAQAIEKLRLRFGSGKLSVDQIQDACADNARFDIFGLVDTVLSGQTTHTLRVLSRLQQEGVEPVLLLWALTRELRSLASMHFDMSRGKSFNDACKSQRVWPKRQPLIQRALRHNSLPELNKLLLHAGQIDRIVKGLAAGRVWDELSTLALKFAGAKMEVPHA